MGHCGNIAVISVETRATIANDNRMNKPTPAKSKSKASQKAELRAELNRLEAALNELKVLYEQYFMGIQPLAPEGDHKEVKRLIRKLWAAPFRNSEINYRLKTLENKYQTFNTYWERILREREQGTYSRDVFKAEMRDRLAEQEKRSQSPEGAAERGIKELFETYKSALEKSTGLAQKLDFTAFQQSLVARAKDLREKHGIKKLTFKVVVKDGKVSVQAKPKEE